MSELGFKTITLENLLEPDPTILGFVKFTPYGPGKLTSDDLIVAILEPQLSEFVPREVKKLFEVARGAMCYGYFFYPLYTLSYEQLFRVAETAVTLKCKSLSAPARINSFAQKIGFLIAKSIIQEGEKLRWRGLRK